MCSLQQNAKDKILHFSKFFPSFTVHRKYILTGFALIDQNEFSCWRNVYKEVLNSNKLNTSKP